MVGGRSPLAHDERLYRFVFPERPGRADALPLEHAPELEHQPVPLPQPGRRLRPHPGRHPGAAGRRRRFRAFLDGLAYRAPTRPRTRSTGCSCADAIAPLADVVATRHRCRRCRAAPRTGTARPPGGGCTIGGAWSITFGGGAWRGAPGGGGDGRGAPPTGPARHCRQRRQHAGIGRGQRRQFEQDAARALRRADRRRAQADRLQHQIAVEARADRVGLGRLAVDRDQRHAAAASAAPPASAAPSRRAA